jgi:GNAT superfamily N-acetyltransferase
MENRESLSDAVRQAKADDVPAIHDMHVAWEAEGITGGFSADAEECIAGKLERYFLVAETDGQLVGFVRASLRVSENTGFFADGQQFVCIDDLYVRPEYRGRGIGGQLVQELTRLAESDGIRRFALTSNTKDFERVVRFYRRCGFETWNVTMFKQSTEGDK